jgi:uncharacterized membrane protein
MKNKNLTKQLCRAGIICALYVALTYAFMPFAFGSFQIRPAEALCILPLFFPEAIPALFIGCALSNLASPYAVFDVPIGALTTLLAAFGSYMVGRFCQKEPLRFLLGGIFPVLLNAFIIPVVFLYLYGDTTASAIVYFSNVLSIFLSQAVWVYGLGSAVYYPIKRIKDTWLHS